MRSGQATVFAASFLLVTVAETAGDVLFVDDGARAGGDGQSWATAFDEVWKALDAAAIEPAVTEIRVAAGLYTPNRGSGDRDDSFNLVDGVALIGGFAGGDVLVDESDPVANPTILSGDFNMNDAASDTDGDGLVEFANYDENALNVVEANNVVDARIDGFTIRSGNANYDGADLRGGGGLFLFLSSVIVENCAFHVNTAGTEEPDLGGFGGGLFILGGNVDVRDCLFEDNRGMNGGGLAIGSRPDLSTHVDVSVTIDRCEFRRCFSDFQTGGAMWTATGDPLGGTTIGQVTVRDCVFEDCFGDHHGAWTDQNTPELLVEDCVFRNNGCNGFGGAFSHSQSAGPDVEPAQVRRCVFEGNQAGSVGAATLIQATNIVMESCSFVENAGSSIVRTGPLIGFSGGGRSLTLINCLIADNAGIGVLSDDAPMLKIVDSTIANNTATGLGVTAGGVVADIDEIGQSVVLDNSIFWGNVGDSIGQAGQIQVLDGGPTVNFCLVEGLTGSFGGAGNIDGDPSFIDQVSSDYRLSTVSPAIDAADNTRVPDDISIDLDGNPRFIDDPATIDTGFGNPPVVDMGAYEFQANGVTCPADIDGDIIVGPADLALLLGAWGDNPGHPADLDSDGTVGPADLAQLLGAWGVCR